MASFHITVNEGDTTSSCFRDSLLGARMLAESWAKVSSWIQKSDTYFIGINKDGFMVATIEKMI